VAHARPEAGGCVVQEVWRAFFGGATFERPWQSQTEFAGYLAAVARRQAARAVREHLGAKKRDARSEQSLDEARHAETAFLVARGTTPSDDATLEDFWHYLLDREPPTRRRVMDMLRAGLSRDEIGRLVGISEKTVDRVASGLRHGLQSVAPS
jgi:DNA-directed RNA polymerase specialized sigma24 family protein